MAGRIAQQFNDVSQTSNGIASGTSLTDAVLQGLYELVERDGWTIGQYLREMTGIAPRKVPLAGLPLELDEVVDKIRHVGLYPFLFDCTALVGRTR
jgi:ribosomal protein S12 methylthiotransferase accessory factor YcaO